MAPYGVIGGPLALEGLVAVAVAHQPDGVTTLSRPSLTRRTQRGDLPALEPKDSYDFT